MFLNWLGSFCFSCKTIKTILFSRPNICETINVSQKFHVPGKNARKIVKKSQRSTITLQKSHLFHFPSYRLSEKSSHQEHLIDRIHPNNTFLGFRPNRFLDRDKEVKDSVDHSLDQHSERRGLTLLNQRLQIR